MRGSRGIRSLVAILGGLALSFGFATQASAITINYSQASGFVQGTETHTPGPDASDGIIFFGPPVSVTTATGPVPAGKSTYSTIAWGNGSDAGNEPIGNAPSFTTIPGPFPHQDLSGLEVKGQTGSISSGETKVLSILHHRNIAIGPPVLTQADIFSILTLSGAQVQGGIFTNNNNVRFTFEETDNNPAGGLAGCGAQQISTVPCDDIFTVANFGADFGDIHFNDNLGNPHTLSFSVLCDPVSTTTRCDFSNLPVGRLITAENNINELQILITLDANRVPAPASLLLLGFGLLGAGVATWRKSR